jgi:hypothetical protein
VLLWNDTGRAGDSSVHARGIERLALAIREVQARDAF